LQNGEFHIYIQYDSIDLLVEVRVNHSVLCHKWLTHTTLLNNYIESQESCCALLRNNVILL